MKAEIGKIIANGTGTTGTNVEYRCRNNLVKQAHMGPQTSRDDLYLCQIRELGAIHVFRSTREYLQKQVKPMEIAVLKPVTVRPRHSLS
jgi:hypothetical protein